MLSIRKLVRRQERPYSMVARVALWLVPLLGCDSEAASTKPADDGGVAAHDAGDAGAAECTSHAQCVDAHAEHWICRQPEGKCVSLLAPGCTFVRGDDTDDDAVFVGVLAATIGEAQVFGAADLAREDFATAVGGLPRAAEQGAAPWVLVGCSFALGSDPLPTARHLIATVGVPAVIGPGGSSDAINVVQNVALAAGALVMSPSAQSDLLTELADDDLLFRTNPSTRAVAPQFAAMLKDVEALVRAERSLTEVRVALVAPRDAYGLALGAATAELLRFNGGGDVDANEQAGHYLAVSYDAAEQDVGPVVAKRVIDFAPHIVISLNGFDLRPFQALEETWPADGPSPPYYLIDGGGTAPDHLAFAATRPDALRRRMRIASSEDPERPQYHRYEQRIESEKDPAPGLQTMGYVYDAAYAVAYGIVAASEGTLTGRAIARGLRRLVGSGDKVDVAVEDIERGVATLLSGSPIDLEGVSGPLDFDEHGDVTADGSVTCLVPDAETGNLIPTFSGQVYRVASGELEGSFELCM